MPQPLMTDKKTDHEVTVRGCSYPVSDCENQKAWIQCQYTLGYIKQQMDGKGNRSLLQKQKAVANENLLIVLEQCRLQCKLYLFHVRHCVPSMRRKDTSPPKLHDRREPTCRHRRASRRHDAQSENLSSPKGLRAYQNTF